MSALLRGVSAFSKAQGRLTFCRIFQVAFGLILLEVALNVLLIGSEQLFGLRRGWHELMLLYIRDRDITYIILYSFILYYTILYYTILYYTILYYTILYYTILYYTILYYTILYYTILYFTQLIPKDILYITP